MDNIFTDSDVGARVRITKSTEWYSVGAEGIIREVLDEDTLYVEFDTGEFMPVDDSSWYVSADEVEII